MLSGFPSSDGAMTKIPYWVDVLFHWPAVDLSFPIGLFKIEFLDQAGLT